ncbi:MAG: DsrE family protein [Myxococcales bacterium]|nr:DsrE family protein [Myxococcales bacterium]
MRDPNERAVQIIILAGPAAPERAVFGFASALAAAASGVEVRVVLSMHGAYWAAETTGQAVSIMDFPPIAELIEQLLELQVPIEACSTCVDNYCPSHVDPDGRRMLRKGVDRIGLGLVAMRMAGTNSVIC